MVAFYQKAVELAPGDYYPPFALGAAYGMLRRHEDAIAALTQAAELATKSQTATPDDLPGLYKASAAPISAVTGVTMRFRHGQKSLN